MKVDIELNGRDAPSEKLIEYVNIYFEFHCYGYSATKTVVYGAISDGSQAQLSECLQSVLFLKHKNSLWQKQ